MRVLGVIISIMVFISCGQQPEGGTDVFSKTLNETRELRTPFIVTITEYDGAKPCSEDKIDAAFVQKYLFPGEDQLFKYYACGKKVVNEDITLLVFCEDRGDMYRHGILTLDKEGNMVDKWMLWDSICCKPGNNVNNEPYLQMTTALSKGKINIRLARCENKQSVAITQAEQNIQIDANGKFKDLGFVKVRMDDRVVTNSKAGELYLQMDEKEFLSLKNLKITSEKRQIEGEDYIVYNIVLPGETLPVSAMVAPFKGVISNMELYSSAYKLGRRIRPGGTIGDVRKELNITGVFGMENGKIGVVTTEFPNVYIMLDGEGYEPYPGKIYQPSEIKDAQKIISFFMTDNTSQPATTF